jgi:fluoride exporter
VTRPHPLHPSLLGVVAVGGALGACVRYALSVALPDTAPGFPWTTFTINVTGSFLLALLPVLAVVRRNHFLPPLLGTGVLGGFTTLSTYSEQTRSLVDSGAIGTAASYLLGTLLACLAAVAVADRLSEPPERAEFEDEDGDL